MTTFDYVGFFEKTSDQAREKFSAVVTDDGHTRMVYAEAGTGSRYVVFATELPLSEMREMAGADRLVSVIAPWNVSYAVSKGSHLSLDYVMEKFTPADRTMKDLHGGDVMALALAIAVAIEGQVL